MVFVCEEPDGPSRTAFLGGHRIDPQRMCGRPPAGGLGVWPHPQDRSRLHNHDASRARPSVSRDANVIAKVRTKVKNKIRTFSLRPHPEEQRSCVSKEASRGHWTLLRDGTSCLLRMRAVCGRIGITSPRPGITGRVPERTQQRSGMKADERLIPAKSSYLCGHQPKRAWRGATKPHKRY